MKVGFSFGRCVRDIVNGVVDIDDVMVIVCGTMVSKSKLGSLVDSYMLRRDYLMGLDRKQCLAVARDLWDGGKIHQPRNFGVRRSMAHSDYVWMDLFPTSADTSEQVVKAWRSYLMALKLTADHIPDGQDAPR